MTDLFTSVGIDADSHTAVNTIGITEVFDAVQIYLTRAMSAMETARSIFVEETTEEYKEFYTLPMNGRMAESAEGASADVVSVTGNWDVAYPLRHYNEAVVGNDIDFAYMTAGEFQKHIDGILAHYSNANRYAIMKAILNNTNETFKDKRKGNLTIRRLANGDGAVYPATVSSDTNQTSLDNYSGTNYTSANISAVNDPFATAEAYFHSNFGFVTTGAPIYSYINVAQEAKVRALADFVPVSLTGNSRSANQEYLDGFTDLQAPAGRVIGRVRDVVVSVWGVVPAEYIVSIHMGVEAPLKRRVDPASTGLGGGNLRLMERIEADSISFSRWQARFGYGVGNRMNGFVQQFVASTSYTIPTVYA